MSSVASSQQKLDSTTSKQLDKNGKVLLGLNIHIRDDNEIVKVHEHDKGSRVSHKFCKKHELPHGVQLALGSLIDAAKEEVIERNTLIARKEIWKEEDDYIDSIQFSDIKAPNEQKQSSYKAGLRKNKTSENTQTLNSNKLSTTSAIPVYERLYHEKEELDQRRKLLKEAWQEKQDRQLDGDDNSLSDDMTVTTGTKTANLTVKGQLIQKKLRKRKLTQKENDDLMMILMHDAQIRLEQMLLNEWKIQVKEEQQMKTGTLTDEEKQQLLRRREIRAEQRKQQEKRAQKVLVELEQQIARAMDAEEKALQELIKQKQHIITVKLPEEDEAVFDADFDMDELMRDDTDTSGQKSLKDKKTEN